MLHLLNVVLVEKLHVFNRGIFAVTDPDWAIVYREGSVKHVYFIAETKGSMREINLRETEKSKIACAKRHFASLSTSTVKYDVVKSYEDLFNLVNKE